VKLELSKRFYRDELGNWWRKYETGMEKITDINLIDTLDLRWEFNNDISLLDELRVYAVGYTDSDDERLINGFIDDFLNDRKDKKGEGGTGE